MHTPVRRRSDCVLSVSTTPPHRDAGGAPPGTLSRPWTSTSIRASSSSRGSAFRYPTGWSRRPRRRPGRRPSSSAAPVVVKAQVLVGGRGKAGGIKLAATPDEAEAKAGQILGLDIRGHVVRRLWIERASDIAREYYFSITFDRGAKKPLFMLTTQGGVDIEEVAAETPDKLARLHLDPLTGFQPFHAQAALLRRRDPGRGDPAGLADHREGLPRVRRDRRHAGRDQPADRHPGRHRARARLEVHGRRQRALPPPRHRRHARRRGGRPAGADGPRARRHLRQARRRHRHPRQRRRAWSCRRSTWSPWPAAGRPTSSTSAAAPRRTRSSPRWRCSSPTTRCGRSCSTSSAASPAATRWRAASWPRSSGSTSTSRSSSGWTAPTTSRAASCWPTRRRPTCTSSRRCWAPPRASSSSPGSAA